MNDTVEDDMKLSNKSSIEPVGNPLAEEPDGTLVFTPAAVMTAHEAALLRNPELVAQIEADRADPSQAIPSKARRPRRG